MCKTKMAVDASDPNSARTRRTRATQSPPTPSAHRLSTSATTASSNSARTRLSQSPRTASGYRLPSGVSSSSSTSDPQTTTSTSSANYTTTSSSILSSRTSLSSLRDSLSQNPHIYDFSEIRTATNNFLAKRHSSSSSSTPCWRCNLRGTDTIVFQRKFRRKIETLQLKQLLAVICRSNHGSVIKLLGASISGDHIYLVYEFIKGSNLADCLRNSRNPHYTVLSTWLSRMQIAYDLAAALDYIHNKTGLNLNLVHSHIKSSSIIVTEPNFNGRICHFGAAQLCGELTTEDDGDKKKRPISIGEIREANEEDDDASPLSPEGSKKLTRSDSRAMQFEGVRGYMSPEFRSTGTATQKSDVYAFGVVILELLSGEEPLKYKYDKSSGDFVRTSVIDTANAAIHGGDNAVDGGREGSLRRWIDRKLKDSFPVDVAEKLTRLALECVHVDPDKRPDMGRVEAKMSRMYLKSEKWSVAMKMPTDQISVSLAPR